MKQLPQTDKITTTPHKFYPRVINETNITFTNEEMTILSKVLKYNLNFKPKIKHDLHIFP